MIICALKNKPHPAYILLEIFTCSKMYSLFQLYLMLNFVLSVRWNQIHFDNPKIHGHEKGALVADVSDIQYNDTHVYQLYTTKDMKK